MCWGDREGYRLIFLLHLLPRDPCVPPLMFYRGRQREMRDSARLERDKKIPKSLKDFSNNWKKYEQWKTSLRKISCALSEKIVVLSIISSTLLPAKLFKSILKSYIRFFLQIVNENFYAYLWVDPKIQISQWDLD